jgi:hypothetical protein
VHSSHDGNIFCLDSRNLWTRRLFLARRLQRVHCQSDGARRRQRYIANQADHHRVKPYREELIEMLRSAGVDFDEKFLD